MNFSMANKKAQYVLVANKDCFNFIIAYEEPQWTIKKADQYPTVPPRITNFFLFPLSIHSPLNEQEAYLLLFKGHKKNATACGKWHYLTIAGIAPDSPLPNQFSCFAFKEPKA